MHTRPDNPTAHMLTDQPAFMLSIAATPRMQPTTYSTPTPTKASQQQHQHQTNMHSLAEQSTTQGTQQQQSTQ